MIALASLGAVNIHPSLLPKYRGRAAINWAVINGENEFGLSVHFVDAGVDSGDIISQVKIPIDRNDYIGDLLNKSYPIYYDITNSVIKKFINNNVTRMAQIGEFPVYPKRTADDGKINWNKPGHEIINLIRAVSKPYPGAFSFLNGSKFLIWKAISYLNEECYQAPIGSVISKNANGSIKIKCLDGFIEVLDFEVADKIYFEMNEGDIMY